MLAQKLCDLFGGKTEVGPGFLEDRRASVFLGYEGLGMSGKGQRSRGGTHLVFGIVALAGYEELIKNGVDVGAEVGQVRALGPDEVGVDRIKLIFAYFSHDGNFVCVVSGGIVVAFVIVNEREGGRTSAPGYISRLLLLRPSRIGSADAGDVRDPLPSHTYDIGVLYILTTHLAECCRTKNRSCEVRQTTEGSTGTVRQMQGRSVVGSFWQGRSQLGETIEVIFVFPSNGYDQFDRQPRGRKMDFQYYAATGQCSAARVSGQPTGGICQMQLPVLDRTSVEIA